MNQTTAKPETDKFTCPVRQAPKKQKYHRAASFTDVEKVFLSFLLIDRAPTTEGEDLRKKKTESAKKVLTEDVLFSLPFIESLDDNHKAGRTKSIPHVRTRSNPQLELWKAHEDGVAPAMLRAKSSCGRNDDKDSPDKRNENSLKKTDHGVSSSTSNIQDTGSAVDSLQVHSDHEVGQHNDESSASSWGSSQGGFDHYNTWEVIKDEYAADFGFNVATDNENHILPCNEDDSERGMFKIIGTSAEDTSAIPHVLSPPLMESLLNFVPERLSNDNFWLKFSLIRDGASLDILRKYCRAANHSILAIETTNGEVFGSFTSAPWRTNNKYFGTGESFLWRMRHNRNTPVFSLFEQAQLESEIDVFPYNGSNCYIQLCTNDKIALGGGSVMKPDSEGTHAHSIVEESDDGTADVYLEWSNYGFGLALDELLLHGTTSPCATFGNPNLMNSGGSGELFDVLNLEVWTFTSAQNEREAQRSEMSMFFVRESVSSSLRSVSRHTSTSSLFSKDDFDREKFYRRVGQSEDDDTDRNAWQYSNMMNPMSGSPYKVMRDRDL
ncbi:hypothetical protein ACHAW6_012069 [Cyclotella cf. meneghiniana]